MSLMVPWRRVLIVTTSLTGFSAYAHSLLWAYLATEKYVYWASWASNVATFSAVSYGCSVFGLMMAFMSERTQI